VFVAIEGEAARVRSANSRAKRKFACEAGPELYVNQHAVPLPGLSGSVKQLRSRSDSKQEHEKNSFLRDRKWGNNFLELDSIKVIS
jgi:hypothetical protein